MLEGPNAPHLTLHAIVRYQERVEDVPAIEIARRLDTPTIRKAIAFGARAVKLGSGHRVILSGSDIVTVTPPKGMWI